MPLYQQFAGIFVAAFLFSKKKHVPLPSRSTKILLPYLFVCVFATCRPHSPKNHVFFGRFSSKHPLFVGPEHVELLGGSTLGSCEKTAASKYLHPCGRILTQYHVFFDIPTFLKRKCTQKIVGKFLQIVQIAIL